MKTKEIKANFKKIIQNLFLKLIILKICLKEWDNFKNTYIKLTKIRKSSFQYSVKKKLIENPPINIKDNFINKDWGVIIDDFKKYTDYFNELNKSHVEHKISGCYGNSSPIFYEPEIIDIHNESLNEIKGVDLNTLIKEEKELADKVLKKQEINLNKLSVSEKNKLGIKSYKHKVRIHNE